MNRETGLPRYDYYRGPKALGDMWIMTRGALTMRCALSTHSLGWEIRLTAGASFSRVEVCKTESSVFDRADAWKAEATAQGWMSQ
jgi:hypothetical protein